MTLDDLKAIDIPAAWARLTPDQQATLGQTALAWQLASLTAETASSQEDFDDAGDMADEAHDSLAAAVEAAFPDIDWSHVPSSSNLPSHP